MSRMEISTETYRQFWRACFERYLNRGYSTRDARQQATFTIRNAFIPQHESLQLELEKDLEDARLHISE